VYEQIRYILLSEDGGGFAEYGLIVTLIAIGCVGAVFAFQDSVTKMYQDIQEKVTNLL